jgi:hypothetical protein
MRFNGGCGICLNEKEREGERRKRSARGQMERKRCPLSLHY